MDDFKQFVLWEGTMLGDSTKDDFEKFIMQELGCRVKFIEEIITLPSVVDGETVEDTGGRHDLLFAIHNGDIAKFSVSRLAYGMRWWEDVLDNMVRHYDVPIYSRAILSKYRYGWDGYDSAFVERYGGEYYENEE